MAEHGSIAILVEAMPRVGFLILCSCTISPASAVAASRRQVVPLPAHHGPLTSGRGSIPSTGAQDRKMLQLQERLGNPMRSKGEKGRHWLGNPSQEPTKGFACLHQNCD